MSDTADRLARGFWHRFGYRGSGPWWHGHYWVPSVSSDGLMPNTHGHSSGDLPHEHPTPESRAAYEKEETK